MSKTPLSLYSSYYIDTKVDSAAVTNYGGIFPYLDLLLLTGLPKVVSDCLPAKSLRGWQHAEHIAALLVLNLTGGDCVDDLVKLSDDPGISLYMRQIAQAVGARNRQFTRGGQRDIPSLTSVREWLEQFHLVGGLKVDEVSLDTPNCEFDNDSRPICVGPVHG